MWTPRRLLLFVLSFAGFFSAYLVYDHFLGHYDGLPPLPAEYRPGPARSAFLQPGATPAEGVGLTAQLERAFGPNCEEKKRRLFEWRAQGILVATEEWKLQPSGRLLLTKVSVALFSKPRAGQVGDEINTVKADEAEIEFDQPVKDLRDAAKRKPIAGELRGNVMLKNNRRTVAPEDDVRLLTSWLKYRDDQQRIWTAAPVRIVDDATGAVATAIGLEVELTPNQMAASTSVNPRARSPRPSVAGVRTVRLQQEVRMEWPDDGRSSFLAGGERQPPAAGPPRPPAAVTGAAPPKSLIVVQCAGPFVFHVEQERAEFADQVQVLREHQARPGAPAGPPRYDQLTCETLHLQFVRKEPRPGVAPASGDSVESGWDIVAARARGKNVELLAEDESGTKTLHAQGGELVYDKVKRQTQLSSILGRPLMVEMQGHVLRLSGTLTLLHPPEGGRHLQAAHAEGPGEIRVRAPQPGEANTPPLVATWQKALYWTKEAGLDRLQFLHQASFTDPRRGRLEANEQIVVWIANLDAGEQGAGSGTPKAAPRRLEAAGEVRLSALELIIRRAERLVVVFKEPTALASPAAAPSTPSMPGMGATTSVPLTTAPLTAASPGAAAGPRKPPLIVEARLLDLELVRLDQRYEAERVRAEGRVAASQAAQTAGTGPLELRADRLDLRRVGSDHLIDLFGQPASVQFDRLTLVGPVIKLDQQQNTVEVAGRGTMKMPTRTDFQGARLKEDVDVVVTWTERMLFDGKLAEFIGQVVAEQQGARLSGNDLRVELASRIPLRESGPGNRGPTPTMTRLLGGGGVLLEKRGERPGEFQRIRGQELDFNNESERRLLRVRGPGQADILQLTREAQAVPNPSLPAREELKLTRVLFEGIMEADQQLGILTFREALQMFHLSSQNIDMELNPDALPKGALYLTCEEIQATVGKSPGGAAPREFRAANRVRVHANEFTAIADDLKYDESKELLVLEGRGANRATLVRQTRPGAPRDPFSSKQIRYDRLRQQVQTSETDAIFINPPTPPPRR